MKCSFARNAYRTSWQPPICPHSKALGWPIEVPLTKFPWRLPQAHLGGPTACTCLQRTTWCISKMVMLKETKFRWHQIWFWLCKNSHTFKKINCPPQEFKSDIAGALQLGRPFTPGNSRQVAAAWAYGHFMVWPWRMRFFLATVELYLKRVLQESVIRPKMTNKSMTYMLFGRSFFLAC